MKTISDLDIGDKLIKIGEELKYIYGDKLQKHMSMGVTKYNVDIE